MQKTELDTDRPPLRIKSDPVQENVQQLAVTNESPKAQYNVPGYTLIRPVAKGSSGAVFVGRSQLDGSQSAIKIFHKQLIPNPEAMARFEREVETLKRLNHPNIVKILGYGTTEESAPFIAMELVEGVSIRTVLDIEGVFLPRRAAFIAREICRVLEVAHAQSFIHRDLKPSNIVLGSGDVVKLIDFGIAKAAGSSNDTVTEYGAIIGTPAYMSPEQCLGQKVDRRSDIYAVGCTLFEMLTGTKAFESATSVEAIAKQIDIDRSNLIRRVRLTGAPPALQSIVIKCLARRAADRYSSAAQLDHDLSAFLLDIPLKFASNNRAKQRWILPVIFFSFSLLANLTSYKRDAAPVNSFDPNAHLPRARPMPWTNSPHYQHPPTPRPSPNSPIHPPPSLSGLYRIGMHSGRPPIKIYNHSDRQVIFSDPDASDLKEALKHASDLHSSLSHADLHNADLAGTDLSNLDLSFADLTGANLTGSTLIDIDLHGATLTQADLGQAKLSFVNLQDAKLNMANLKQVSGQHAMLSGADLSSCRLMMAHLERASCLQANFANADLNWTNLNDADCTGANFEHANLSGTNLVKADCSRANFFDTKMMNTNLSGANLSYVSLARAHPALACLKEAKLSHTDFGINRLSTDGFLNSKSALASPAKVSDGI